MSAAGLCASAAKLRLRARAEEENQAELAHLHLVSAGQLRFPDPLPVHVRAVQAAHVADGEPVARTIELGVPPRDGHVVKEDVAIRVTADQCEVAVEEEPAPGIRPAPDD